MTNEELDELMKTQIDTKLSAAMYTNLPSISASQVSAIAGANTIGYANGASGMNSNISGAAIKSQTQEKIETLIDAVATIEKRLAILVPDPAKLKQFEALRKAYDHYKMLESMCQMPEKKDGC